MQTNILVIHDARIVTFMPPLKKSIVENARRQRNHLPQMAQSAFLDVLSEFTAGDLNGLCREIVFVGGFALLEVNLAGLAVAKDSHAMQTAKRLVCEVALNHLPEGTANHQQRVQIVPGECPEDGREHFERQHFWCALLGQNYST